jgi:quinoprotein glucose dehydrogenase
MPILRTCLFIALAAAFPSASPAQDAAKPAAQPERTIAEESTVLEKGRTSARQRALARLGVHSDPAADELLRKQFERYRSGELPPALWLDLFEAMAKRKNATLKALLADREARLAKSADPVRRYEECLEGGNGEEGRAIFTKKPEAGCVRCHSVDGKGGQIGPELTWLRKATERSHILESIVMPNSTVAPGFETVALKLKNGETVAGIVRSETAEEISLASFVDGKRTTVKLSEVAERTPLPSPMPPAFGHVLDKRAIRDLVEFIAAGD